MASRSNPALVFAVLTAIGGLVYWRFADWCAYVDFGKGPECKFKMPWWWQVIESGIVGLVAGGMLTGLWLWSLARWVGNGPRHSADRSQ
jgi:hypothetical protein